MGAGEDVVRSPPACGFSVEINIKRCSQRSGEDLEPRSDWTPGFVFVANRMRQLADDRHFTV